MSYGIMLQRLKQEEAREGRRVVETKVAPRRAAPGAAPRGQTPTEIVLAALYERPRRPRRRAA
jgi:hypothetical protein